MAFYKPPANTATRNRNNNSVFLAGSIEMGAAENWQDIVGEFFHQKNWNVLNPRRDDWDSSWKQTFEDAQFYQQVNWELNALEQADLIIMYFDPNTKSPISLLELGLFARSNKIKVVCPDGFWRKGNVEVVCDYYNIPFYNKLSDLFLDLE
jgi:hypothetical protein